jgi:DNA primase
MEINDIKKQLSILAVLAKFGIKPGKNHRVNCPFHNDKTPSMQVYPETNTVFCFSSNCQLNGKAIDQIDFIKHKENCTKHEAILKAKAMIGAGIIETVNHKNQLKMNYQDIFQGLKQSLANSKKATEYLQSRNINDITLEIGYNPASGLSIEAAKNFKGLRNCIVFPLKDKSGNITSLYGRSISNSKESKHFYTANRKGLYPGYPEKETTTLILTESIIDTATIIKYYNCTGAKFCVSTLALYGTNGLTEEHLQAILELEHLKEIILFFDGDEAGEKAAQTHFETLHTLKPEITISKVETPQGEDPNSLVQGHEPEILTHLIETRTFLFSTETSIEKKKEVQTQNFASQQYRLDTKNPEFIVFTKEELIISILGGIALHPLDKLKVTIKIERTDRACPVSTIRHSLDLYYDDQSEKLIRKAAERLETGTKAMQLAIAELTQALEDYRTELIELQKPPKEEKRQLTEKRITAAKKYLSAPELLKRTNEDIGKTGITGEECNRLLMYLVFTSRLREQPLHIISLGASGTGKTYLQERIGDLIPEDQKLEITMLSENAFYYFGQQELRHKLILIEDLDGAENVLYPLRELQSKKRISKTIPIKDSKGNLKTITMQVEGPICLAGTTTREKLYEDNANRSILIYLDNTKQHKESIMDYQRKLSAGSINHKKEEELKELFKDMQSVLKPIKVRNPYAEMLKIPETVFKPLRTNAHYLAFIETVTFYHQYQREHKTDQNTGETYIETTLEDIEWANFLLKDVLLAKSDELTNACRDFFEKIKHWLAENDKASFFKSDIREAFRTNPSNLKYYLQQLALFGYIKIVGGNKYKQGFEYEITSQEEYQELKGSLDNALDQALERVKQRLSGDKDEKAA